MRVTIQNTVLALAIASSALLSGQVARGADSTPPASGQAQQPAAPEPGQQPPPAPPPRVLKDIRPTGQIIVLPVSQGTVLRLPGDTTTVFVADQGVADVQLMPPDMIFVTARKAGATAVYAMDAAGNILLNKFIDVRGAATIIRGAKIDPDAPPPGPLILQIPLQLQR